MSIHVKVLLESLQACISDVDTVEEGKKEQRKKDRDHMEITLANELLFRRTVNRVLGLCRFNLLSHGVCDWDILLGVCHSRKREYGGYFRKKLFESMQKVNSNKERVELKAERK